MAEASEAGTRYVSTILPTALIRHALNRVDRRHRPAGGDAGPVLGQRSRSFPSVNRGVRAPEWPEAGLLISHGAFAILRPVSLPCWILAEKQPKNSPALSTASCSLNTKGITGLFIQC